MVRFMSSGSTTRRLRLIVATSLWAACASIAQPIAQPELHSHLPDGQTESEHVDLRGVVHSAELSETGAREALLLVVDVGGRNITARVQEVPRKDFTYLVDALVRLRGVYGTTYDEKRHLIGSRLFVADFNDVQVEESSPSDPFAIPTLPIPSLLKVAPARAIAHRVKVSGIVTAQRIGRTLYLQSGNDGIQVQTSQETVLESGSEVEVLGFVAARRNSAALRNAIFRKIGQSTPPKPVHVTAADVIQVKDGIPFAPWSGLLVQLDGEVVARTQHGDEQVWIVRDGGKVFEVEMEEGADAESLTGIENGTRVRLTGICKIELNEDREAQSFKIVLGSADGFGVLREPLLTLPRLFWIAGVLILLSLATLGWMVRVRRPPPTGSFEPAFTPGNFQSSCRWGSRVAGLLNIGLGLLVLVGGWACNIAALRSVLHGYSQMRPNTALGILLLGLAVWLNGEYDTSTWKRRVVRMCAGLSTFIGLVTLLEYALRTNLHFDELMFRKSVLGVAPGRMALMTALNLVLLGGTLLFSRYRRGFVACQYLVVIAGCFGIFNLVGYLYGVTGFFGLAFHMGAFFSTAMALHTAMAFVILAAGALLSRPDWGMMATVTSEAPGGVLTRSLLPCALVIPAALGWLRWQGQLRGLYDTAFGLTLFASSNIVIFTFMIWRSGILLNRLDLERSGAERDLRESEANFRLLADAMPQIVWTAKPDGNIEYYNQRWSQYTGMTIAQSQDWGWQPILHPDDLQNTIDRWTRSFTTGEPLEVEYRIRRASDGVYRWYLGRAVAVHNSGGKIVRWFGTCTDIEDYKQLNEQLEDRVRQRTAQLETANQALVTSTQQLEASNLELHDFASVASHDLQEPLRKVQVFGSRLKNDYGAALDTQGRDFLERMLNAAQRMRSLVEDLLAFSRVTSQARPFVAVDLSSVTQEVLSDLEVRIAETAARVEVGDLPIIDADPLQMRQLLQNLIGNALKFRKKGCSPRVRVQAGPDAEDGSVRLTVEDDGIGFDEKYLDRIFTVFQRLHGRTEYEGTGIGLAICRKIAQRHGGEITAMSAAGQGATFVVNLPRRTIQPSIEGSDTFADMNQSTVLSER